MKICSQGREEQTPLRLFIVTSSFFVFCHVVCRRVTVATRLLSASIIVRPRGEPTIFHAWSLHTWYSACDTRAPNACLRKVNLIQLCAHEAHAHAQLSKKKSTKMIKVFKPKKTTMSTLPHPPSMQQRCSISMVASLVDINERLPLQWLRYRRRHC